MKSQLIDFKNIHKGKTCIVCGTGDSIAQMTLYYIKKINNKKAFTIGVNDIVKHFTPSYHVVVDNITLSVPQYRDKHRRILESRAKYFFSFHPLNLSNSKLIRFKYNGFNSKREIDEIFGRGNLFTCRTSVIVAISLAIYMGFTKIGVIGFDLKNHPIIDQLPYISNACSIINEYCKEYKIKIFNLSKYSLVNGLEYKSLKDFLEEK